MFVFQRFVYMGVRVGGRGEAAIGKDRGESVVTDRVWLRRQRGVLGGHVGRRHALIRRRGRVQETGGHWARGG